MTEGMKLQDAREIAVRILKELEPYCKRVQIAGSIRRGKQIVKDIEIVAEPKYQYQPDLFGNMIRTSKLLTFPYFDQMGSIIKAGEKFVQIDLREGIKLDLFIVTPPAQWGVIYLIRTGPAAFSRWMVTQRRKGGALPSNAKVKDGCIYNDDLPFMTYDEIDFFSFNGLEFIDPKERKPLW